MQTSDDELIDFVGDMENISRFSEAAQNEAVAKAKAPPPPKHVSFKDIPAQAFKPGSMFSEINAQKFNPATDSVADAVSGRPKAHKGKKPPPPHSPSSPVPKDKSKEEKERVAWLKQVNGYLSNKIIVTRLSKRGLGWPLLPMDASLEEAKERMNDINEGLSGDVSKGLVLQGINGLNVVTESMVPILKQQHPQDLGLSQVFFIESNNPESDIALSVEELGIMMKPYLPVAGAFSRFAMNYTAMCMKLAKVKHQRASPNETEEYYDEETPVEEGEGIPE
jgi:hypothetical protein